MGPPLSFPPYHLLAFVSSIWWDHPRGTANFVVKWKGTKKQATANIVDIKKVLGTECIERSVKRVRAYCTWTGKNCSVLSEQALVKYVIPGNHTASYRAWSTPNFTRSLNPEHIPAGFGWIACIVNQLSLCYDALRASGWRLRDHPP